jgi:hypothetical protein
VAEITSARDHAISAAAFGVIDRAEYRQVVAALNIAKKTLTGEEAPVTRKETASRG